MTYSQGLLDLETPPPASLTAAVEALDPGDLERLIAEELRRMAPPPKLTVSEVAEAERRLSSEASAAKGRWKTRPYQREIMDVFTDPDIETIVVMSCAQIVKTEIILNSILYAALYDPGPMLYVAPTLTMGDTFSTDRLAPMIRDSAALKKIFGDPRSRDSGNTVRRKEFPGGIWTAAGGNSAASLAGRPIRYLWVDDLDRLPPSAGTEGDPYELARMRTSEFYNAKIGIFSTPTWESTSRINEEFEKGDKRFFFVPCPYCETPQRLVFSEETLVWDKEGEGPDRHRFETTHYICGECNKAIDEAARLEMLRGGFWKKTAVGDGRTASFHLSQLYKESKPFEDTARRFIKAKRGGALKLRVFVNTVLGETFKDEAQGANPDVLFIRRDHYPAPVPAGGLVVVGGADIQKDRIELDLRAFGRHLQNWGLLYRVFYGDPLHPEVWEDLSTFLTETTFRHEWGADLPIAAVGIDSGYLPDMVYAFSRAHPGARYWPTKGDNAAEGAPLYKLTTPRSGKNRRPVELMTIGTDTAKSMIYTFLDYPEAGPGYCHWSADPAAGYDLEYFRQLCAEEFRIEEKRGRKSRVWHQLRPRNEALDCFVGALATLSRLNPVWTALEERLAPDDDDDETTPPPPPLKAPGGRRPKRWVDRR